MFIIVSMVTSNKCNWKCYINDTYSLLHCSFSIVSMVTRICGLVGNVISLILTVCIVHNRINRDQE